MKKLLIAITCLLAVGCAEMQTYSPQLRSDWDTTLYRARQSIDGGNYFAADKLIDEFVRTHPDTRQAREIAFWKAAYLLDPANDHGSLPAGIAGLDGYLNANPDGWYRNEATVLRRTAAVADAIANATKALAAATDSSSTVVVRDTVVVGSKSRDEQIAALKDQLAQSKAELAKVSAELDRIKKRLANPSN
jgi:hypothetical protein